MTAPMTLRDDYDSVTLRQFAQGASDAVLRKRALALAAVYDGVSRKEAASIGGVGVQIFRDWVRRFNLEGLEGLSDRPYGCNKVKPEAEAEIAELISRVPRPSVFFMSDILYRKFGLSIDARTLYQYIRKADYNQKSYSTLKGNI